MCHAPHFYKHDHQCLPCLHAVSPTGTNDRPAPPKPRRSPAREPPQLVLSPTLSSLHIEPTESNSPQSPMEAEEEAPQCRFQMDCLSFSFTLGLFFSLLEAALLVFFYLIRPNQSLCFCNYPLLPNLFVRMCVFVNTALCPHMLSISPSATWAT